MRRLLAALAAAALATACGATLAQADYPSKPVRLVVGFAAGGISDVLARALAVKLAPGLGQQVIVDNKPGAGTTIAGEFVARSAPDGYTIWLHDITTHAINASLYAKLPYDSLQDFTPITLVASTPLMLVIHPSTPASSVAELIALLKARPGYYSYGSSGTGTIVHLSSEMLKTAAGGLDVLHVPYKGSAPATTAILAGEVTFVFSTMPPAVASVRGGKLRALAVTTPKRTVAAPEVPTMIEAGLPGFEIVLYSGILGPAGISPGVVRRLHAEFVKVVNDPDIRAVYEKIGAEPITDSPEAFRAMIAGEIAKLGPVVRASGARVE
jgi:tripartite-type tricarboxylate transporter receptor subunit TctC